MTLMKGMTSEELRSRRAAAAMLGVVVLVFHGVIYTSAGALLLQDLAGGASVFRGQDIMGGRLLFSSDRNGCVMSWWGSHAHRQKAT